ncbi:MAG: sigma-70 family RNA polymerase sigma factor [Lachnospiraceae bacterium]|nr:sigma-70 family RNA polymerase sigma factor [Lachnospiraceae bacterium]
MDEDIVELLRDRDQKSVELIAERYERLIRYIAVTILRDREADVEECMNDVYLKLWTHGAAYDYKKASFRTYLKAITRNTALNYLRKLRRLEELEGLDEKDTLQSEYIDYTQNVEQQMIFREEVQALERVLNDLKKKDRELVLRRFYYLQSTRQIAESMSMSENAVDSRLSRLKKKIRKRYEKEVAK